MSDAANEAPTTPARRAGNFGWIIYFVFLVVASVGVTVWMIYFNLSIQLTPEQIAAAQARWEEKGPSDYKLLYTERLNDDIKPITFAVTVKNRKAIDARKSGSEIEQLDEAYSMDGLLALVKRTLEEDRKLGAKKVYTIARFDDQTGALLYYVRRVMGTTERLELDVKMNALSK